MTKSGLVEDEKNVRAMLSREVSHIRLLRLAYKGDLTGEPSRFEKYVFLAISALMSTFADCTANSTRSRVGRV